MWEITKETDDRRVYVLDPGKTFGDLNDIEKQIIYESAIYLRQKVETEFAQVVFSIGGLADSLTTEEWSQLPSKVYDFLLQYKRSEEKM